MLRDRTDWLFEDVHFPNELGAENYLVMATRPVYDERPMNSVMTGVVQSGYLRQENRTYLERALPLVEFEYSRVQMQDEKHEIDAEVCCS
jgi:hypothetical protein